MTTPLHIETILTTSRRAREHISTRQADARLAAANVSPARQPAEPENAPEAPAEGQGEGK